MEITSHQGWWLTVLPVLLCEHVIGWKASGKRYDSTTGKTVCDHRGSPRDVNNDYRD